MNETIQKALDKTREVLAECKMNNRLVACSISGGSDSDLLIDICESILPHFVQYVFFDTGIEFQATKEHLKYLENRYNIKIERRNAKCPVPLGNKKYGKPFLSKRAAEMIDRLQKHNFQWEDEPYDTLVKKYPRAISAIKWWCNEGLAIKGNGKPNTMYGICNNPWLKEFLMKTPPPFKVSQKCCEGAKKKTANVYEKEVKPYCMIVGVRKYEGGIRAQISQMYSYSTSHGLYRLYPLLFFTDNDKQEYAAAHNIAHSRCYTEYGMTRTGCSGCPFSPRYNAEREVIHNYEPKLEKAVNNMWADVYEYTDKFHEFQRIMNLKYKRKKKCACGCVDFDPDTVAMNLKIFGREGNKMLCKECFKKDFNWSEEEWNNEIEKFKSQGCELF